jgi:pimeloyl-ACP methyl ester carboxylesterase
MPFAPLADVTIHYQLLGHGEPLLLIMGYRGSGFMWGEEFLELLARDFQVIAFDNRGTGLSDKPNTAYTMATMADDAAGLLSHLGIARANVFGVSMGGMIAQELALRHPRRVKRLILGCTSCGGPQAIIAPVAVLEPFLTAAHVPREEAVRRQWPAIFSPGFLAQQNGFLDRLTARALAYPTPYHTAVRQMLAMQRFTTYGRLGQIIAPTLVVTGDADILIPPANSTILVERLPVACLHIMPGVGHGFFWEVPEAVGALLRTFCAGL